jgi:hypothetical protein
MHETVNGAIFHVYKNLKSKNSQTLKFLSIHLSMTSNFFQVQQ